MSNKKIVFIITVLIALVSLLLFNNPASNTSQEQATETTNSNTHTPIPSNVDIASEPEGQSVTSEIDDSQISNVAISEMTSETKKQQSIPLNATVESSSSSSSTVDLFVVIIILSITTLFSVAISFYLYRWRKILLSNKGMVVPEQWSKNIQELGNHISNLSDAVSNNLKIVANETKINSEKSSNMINTYMELQQALDEKDKEIKRLKNGYDAEIFKRFILRFARIDQAIEDYLEDDKENNFLNQFKRMFEDAFDECGVSRFSPSIGEDYRKANGVADTPKIEKTEELDKDFIISEIIETGYQLNMGNDGYKILIPSKVRIYKQA